MKQLSKYIPFLMCLIAAGCALAQVNPWFTAIWALFAGLWSLWDNEDHKPNTKKEQ